MFTNIPPSSQIYDTQIIARIGAFDEDPYWRMKQQLDEIKYLIEQHVARNHIHQPQQGYDPHSGMYYCNWYNRVD